MTHRDAAEEEGGEETISSAFYWWIRYSHLAPMEIRALSPHQYLDLKGSTYNCVLQCRYLMS